MPALVIGCDEFLGAEVTRQLLLAGETVKGLSLQPYEQEEACKQRLALLQKNANARHFQFIGNLASFGETDQTQLSDITSIYYLPEYDCELDRQEFVLHLSLKLLNICDNIRPRHLVFGSHYSIYPSTSSTLQQLCKVDAHHTHQPLSIQSAIVHAIESLLHGFCAQKRLPCTVLRLFELYGENAPELNLIESMKNRLLNDQEFNLSEFENQTLDFVCVSDAAKILIRAMEHTPSASHDSKHIIPWQIFNLGSGQGTSTIDLLQHLSSALNRPAKTINSLATEGQSWIADPSELMKHMGLKPRVILSP